MKHLSLTILFQVIFAIVSFAQTNFASPFSNNMVLQRNSSVKIWGTELPDTELTLSTSWSEETYQTVSDSQGKWIIFINTPYGSHDQHSLTLTGTETITLSNVLIGEVWVCSGQSNMQWQLTYTDDAPNADDVVDDIIRFLTIPPKLMMNTRENFSATWKNTNAANADWYSAVGYHYAKMLRDSLNIPIGIINSSVGGANIESWIDSLTLSNYSFVNIPTELRPDYPYLTPTASYNGMLHPIIGYGIKGVIWYQGESNRWSPLHEYAQLFPALINSWREKWDIGTFPFYYVQMAPYGSKIDAPFWNMLTDAMYTIDNTGMVVTLDMPDCDEIHPRIKKPIGDRLAYWALSQTYGYQHIVPSGPLCRLAQRIDSTLKIYFDYSDMGLVEGPEGFSGFEIAGPNEQYYEANARINYDNTLILSSPDVSEPKFARYAYGLCSEIKPTLYNNAELPASAFLCQDTLNTGSSEISISMTSTYLELNDSVQLSSSLSQDSVVWTSSNNLVAEVDSTGIVKAISYGTSNITVSSLDRTLRATCLVTVPVRVEGFNLTPAFVSVLPSEIVQLNTVFTPDNATITGVSYQSDNNSVASVNLYGTVKALTEGITNISAVTIDGNYVSSCQFEVSSQPNLALYKKVSFSDVQDTNFNLVDGDVSDSSRWVAATYPQWAEIDLDTLCEISQFEVFPFEQRDYQYSIYVKSHEDSLYQKVVDRSNNSEQSPAIIDEVDTEARFVKIAITGANSYSGSIIELNEFKIRGNIKPIYVTGLKLEPEAIIIMPSTSRQINAFVFPDDASNQQIEWACDNNTVVSIDTSGMLFALEEGLATIRATTKDGGFIATCTVMITSLPNVAINTSITVSDFKNQPGNLIDGISATRWTAEGYPQWAEIDLGADCDIVGFEVLPYQNRDYNYFIESKSNENSSYARVFDTEGLSSEGEIKAHIIALNARYIKITITDANTYAGNWVALNEFRVYGKLQGQNSIHKNELNPIQIFPNPNTGLITIKFEKKLTDPWLSIADLSGRILIHEKLDNRSNTIDISLVKQGVYIIYLKDGNEVIKMDKIIRLN